MQFLERGKYVAEVADGKVHSASYHEQVRSLISDFVFHTINKYLVGGLDIEWA